MVYALRCELDVNLSELYVELNTRLHGKIFSKMKKKTCLTFEWERIEFNGFGVSMTRWGNVNAKIVK